MPGFNAIGMSAIGELIASSPPADTTAPVQGGSISLSAITSSGAHIAWPAGTDNKGVTGYEVSCDTGTAAWVNVGNVLAYDITGKVASTTYTVRVRAYDAAGNRSSEISAVLTTGAASTLPQIPGPVTVPVARTAKFVALARVAVFNTAAPVALKKGALDELYFVGDFSKDAADGATTLTSVSYVSAGVAVLEAPVLQGSLGLVKLGVLDAAVAAPYFTFRVMLANGEQVDRTITLTAFDDRSWVIPKDADDQRYYAFDLSADLALSGNVSIASVLSPIAAGVSLLAQPLVQGKLVIVKLGGMATSSGANNSCSITASLSNTEKLVRAIYLSREDH